MRVEVTPTQIWYAIFGNLPWIVLGVVLIAIFAPLLINIFTNPVIMSMYQIVAYMVPLAIFLLIIGLIIRVVSAPRVRTYY